MELGVMEALLLISVYDDMPSWQHQKNETKNGPFYHDVKRKHAFSLSNLLGLS